MRVPLKHDFGSFSKLELAPHFSLPFRIVMIVTADNPDVKEIVPEGGRHPAG